MVRYGCVAALSVLVLTGCFDTETKMTGETYAGTVKDGLYYKICQSGEGEGRFEPDSGITLSPKPLPDGRTGLEIAGGETMLAEVHSLRHGGGREVWLVGMQEAGKKTYESFIVVTADGVSQAFASIVVPPAVEDRLKAADKTGDAAAMRDVIGAAVDVGDYKMMTTYVAADLLKIEQGSRNTPLPAVLGPVAKAVGQPLPKCE